MSAKTVSFSKNAVNVFFHILTRCNLNCRHCYINSRQHGTRTLPLATIKKWMDQIPIQEKDANIIFLGGEPTLHPDLAAAAAYAKQSGYTSVTIDTNGYLFNNILSKTTPDIIDYISFSLDGVTPETNDYLRGRGSHKKVLSGIKKAVSKGFTTSLIYTVSTVNVHELKQLPELVAGLGINKLFIQVLGIRGKPAQKNTAQSDIARPKITRVDKHRWLESVPATAKKVAEKGISVVYPKVYLAPEEVFECAGQVAENYFIFPNGRVYRCPLCEDFPFHSLRFKNNKLITTETLNEQAFFSLSIPEGCVFNKLIQPDNISYRPDGSPEHKVACCMLKEEITAK